MKNIINRRRQTDFDRRACAVLCWIIGALAAFIVVTVLNGGAK